MSETISLNGMCPGDRARVSALLAKGLMRRRLLDIGLAKNTVVECVGRSPGGDPSAYLIRGAVIAIRREDAEKIRMAPCRKDMEDGNDE